MIDDAADTHKDEPFEDADDNESHNDPFSDLGKQVAFDDLAEAKSDDGDDDGGYDRHPNRKSFDKFFLSHIYCVLVRVPMHGREWCNTYTSDEPGALARQVSKARLLPPRHKYRSRRSFHGGHCIR